MTSTPTLAILALMVSVSLTRNIASTAQENEVIKENNVPKPCCLPNSWTGQLSEVGLVGKERKGQTGEVDAVLTIYQDIPNNFTAYNETVVTNGVTVNLRIVINYNKAVMYIIIPAKKHCLKSQMIEKPANCIPADAEYQGSRRFGMGSASLMVDSWKFRVIQSGMYYQGDVIVTQQGCIPVSQTLSGRAFGQNMMISQVFFDLTEGVKDKSVFDVPDYCRGPVTEDATTNLARSALQNRRKLFFNY